MNKLKVDFKLNLNVSPLSMRANLVQNERTVFKQWNSNEYADEHFKPNQTQDSPIAIIYDGPPYANGPMHLGHLFNKLLKDITCRYLKTQGYVVYFSPGWDCHGLPIEKAVEAQYGQRVKTFGQQKATNLCRTHAQDQINKQSKALFRLGTSVYYQDKYVTMSKEFVSAELKILAELYRNKYICFDKKPVHWCEQCESSLSYSELEHKDIVCNSIYFKAELINLPQNLQAKCLSTKTYLLVWTTTPWTISENEAMAISKESYSYVWSENLQEGLVVGTWAWNHNLSKSFSSFQEVFTFASEDLLSCQYIKPFTQHIRKIYYGEFVEQIQHSTSIVHIAPAHGEDDFRLSRAHHISFENRVGPDGTYTTEHPIFAQKSIKNISNQVIKLLLSTGCLVKQLEISHSTTTCWRHKTPTFFRCTEQCFVTIKNALKFCKEEYIKHINFKPYKGREILYRMMSSRTEWCISRQRYWGCPLPNFQHKITQTPHPELANIIDDLADFIQTNGTEAYYALNWYEELTEKYNLHYYNHTLETLDVWFDSGCVPLITKAQILSQAKKTIVIEGQDQYRGWLQSILFIHSLLKKPLPFNTALIHGYILDQHREKMSKSLGNVIDAEEIVDQYGSDVLKLYVAQTDYTQNIVLSEESLLHAQSLYRKIRNILRFLLSSYKADLYDTFKLLEVSDKFTSINEVYNKYKVNQPPLMDRYLVQEAYKMLNLSIQEYESYNYKKALDIVYHFCNSTLSGLYIPTSRDRQYTCPVEHEDYKSIQVTHYIVLNLMLRTLAPLIPYTIQEVLNILNKDLSVTSLRYTNLIANNQSDSVTKPDQAFVYTLEHVKQKVDHLISHSSFSKPNIGVQIILNCQNLFRVLTNMPQEELLIYLQVAGVEIIYDDSVTCAQYVLQPTSKHKCRRCWKYYDVLVEIDEKIKVCQVCYDLLRRNIWKKRQYL